MVNRAHLAHWLEFQLVFSCGGVGGVGGGGVIYLFIAFAFSSRDNVASHTPSNDTDTDNMLHTYL